MRRMVGQPLGSTLSDSTVIGPVLSATAVLHARPPPLFRDCLVRQYSQVKSTSLISLSLAFDLCSQWMEKIPLAYERNDYLQLKVLVDDDIVQEVSVPVITADGSSSYFRLGQVEVLRQKYCNDLVGWLALNPHALVMGPFGFDWVHWFLAVVMDVSLTSVSKPKLQGVRCWIGWTAPPTGLVKLNFDSSFIVNPGLTSGGGLLRDSFGRWLGSY
ncbi:hypothetical protein K2173_009559 [Erythroxylum novogranatense]|uniref:Ubiquitin-like protease family profile domain-containing protein n=1 Tax=Erythroxylum novogranatense TaxID=1862640 RepID=A0AAV8U713_9ROSI|nr:hypothetical protein K2173_009559 [Erythroxylum novogranatense]